MINCRADRADRSRQMAEAVVDWTPADHYVVVGTATKFFSRRAVSMGLTADRMTCVEETTKTRAIETVERIAGDSALVMGMGNISGPGLDMVQHYRNQHQSVNRTGYESPAVVSGHRPLHSLRKAA